MKYNVTTETAKDQYLQKKMDRGNLGDNQYPSAVKPFCTKNF